MINKRQQRAALCLTVGILFTLLLVLSVNLSASLAFDEDTFKKQQVDQMYAHYQRKAFPTVPTVTAEQLFAWQQSESIILVDVRSPEEQAISMIPESITIEAFQDNLEVHTDKKIVYYCTIGYRSGIEAKKAQQSKFHAYNLYGGVLAWSHAGYSFLRGKKETRDVHVYGKKWNLTAQDYHPIW